VSFDTDGGTPSSIAPIQVSQGLAAGGKFPESPVKSGFRFTGWYDESVTPNKKYDSTTPISTALTLKAHWAAGTGNIIFSLEDWLLNPPTTMNSSSSPRPLARSSSTCTLEVDSAGIRVTAADSTTAVYHGLDFFIDASTATASNGGGAGLNLDAEHYIYEITVSGYIIGTPPASGQIWLVDQNDVGIFKFISPDLTGENAAFTVTGELPANARDTTRIRIRSS